MTEVTVATIQYYCDKCDKFLFELRNLTDKTAYSLEFICGGCGKWHKYAYASSNTPTKRN